ncbi:MAG TPA: DNA mismatch endonuclease Vsr [Candidatus Bathyarchaeia archaeon]|nr:DNA mismatch endonuclease Vsr [Candidatus Bathyarchaeia archaeon]
MDNLTKQQRKRCMSSIRSKDTAPENVVRKALTDMRVRYRLHVGKLPGKPDIVISRLKKVVFINGCFWHQHEGCKWNVSPKTNKNYWKPKLERNIKRQKENIKKLKKLGWKTHIVWECETRDNKMLRKKIDRILI